MSKRPMEESLALFNADFSDVKNVFITHFECERIYFLDDALNEHPKMEDVLSMQEAMVVDNESILNGLSIESERRGTYFELTDDQIWELFNHGVIQAGKYTLPDGCVLRPYRYTVTAKRNDNEVLEIVWFGDGIDMDKPLREIIASRLNSIEFLKHVRYILDENGKPLPYQIKK